MVEAGDHHVGQILITVHCSHHWTDNLHSAAILVISQLTSHIFSSSYWLQSLNTGLRCVTIVWRRWDVMEESDGCKCVTLSQHEDLLVRESVCDLTEVTGLGPHCPPHGGSRVSCHSSWSRSAHAQCQVKLDHSTHDYRQIMKWRRWSCPYILILNTRCRKCQSCTLIYSSLTSLSLEANLLTSLFGSHRLALLPLLELDTDDIPLDSSIPGLTLQSLSHNSGRDVGELDIVESRCSPEWHDE